MFLKNGLLGSQDYIKRVCLEVIALRYASLANQGTGGSKNLEEDED